MRRRDFLLSLFQRAPSILPHEHVLVDFIGAEQVSRSRYNQDEAFRNAKPHIEEIVKFGCRRLQECTPNFLGRDPVLLKRLSDACGIDIWTNTGLYGARNHIFLPAYARQETAEQLARRWEAEFKNGVEGVKPRFVKIGVNRGPLHELDRKLVLAAALTARATGLTVSSHTGDGKAALEQIEIFSAAKADLSKFVWVHAHNEKDHAIHEQAARAGAWVEFDGISPKSLDWHFECVRHMAGKNLLSRTLVSQDAGWYRVGEPGGGAYRPYSLIYTDFLPRMDAAWVTQLTWDNPRRAFGS